MRWMIEIFHKEVKMFLGFEDVSPKWFESSVSHVHWVYCAYILMKYHIPDDKIPLKSMAGGQIMVKKSIEIKSLLCLKQLLTRINGVKELKSLIQKAIAGNSNVYTLYFRALVI